MLCHATENSRLTLACATEKARWKARFRIAARRSTAPDFGQVAFTIEAQSGQPICLQQIHGLSHVADCYR